MAQRNQSVTNRSKSNRSKRLKVDKRYSENRKLAWVAKGIEGLLGFTALIGAGVFAAQSGHDWPTRIIMMLSALTYAAIEIAKIPLSVEFRVNDSRIMRAVAGTALSMCVVLTTISLVKIADQATQPRRADERAAAAALEDAKQKKASFEAQLQLAKDEAERQKAVLAAAQGQVQSASSDLGRVPGCVKNCGKDATASAFRANLRGANAALVVAQHNFDAASQRLSKLDPKPTDEELRAASLAFQNAIANSPLRLVAGTILGLDAQKLTDEQMSWAMRLLVVLPAMLASVTACLLAMLAVTPRKPKPVETSPETARAILKALLWRSAGSGLALLGIGGGAGLAFAGWSFVAAPKAVNQTADAAGRLSSSQVQSDNPPASKADVITHYTIFQTKKFCKGEVQTAWNFASSAQIYPTDQHCMYVQNISDQTMAVITIGTDRHLDLPKTIPPGIDLQAAYANCVWASKNDAVAAE